MRALPCLRESRRVKPAGGSNGSPAISSTLESVAGASPPPAVRAARAGAARRRATHRLGAMSWPAGLPALPPPPGLPSSPRHSALVLPGRSPFSAKRLALTGVLYQAEGSHLAGASRGSVSSARTSTHAPDNPIATAVNQNPASMLPVASAMKPIAKAPMPYPKSRQNR